MLKTIKQPEVKNFEEDEKNDKRLLKETLEREDDPRQIAARLTFLLNQKYASEFGGYLKIEYDLFNDIYTIVCSDGRKRTIDAVDLEHLPADIKMLRKQKK